MEGAFAAGIFVRAHRTLAGVTGEEMIAMIIVGVLSLSGAATVSGLLIADNLFLERDHGRIWANDARVQPQWTEVPT